MRLFAVFNPNSPKSNGIDLFMQPVQDLTVEDRVSRTQFQYSLESPDPQRAEHLGAAADGKTSVACPSCAMSPATNRTAGLEPHLVIDRNAAGRLGISAQTLDDTLYDAFGQRQVSTIFTQLNQYRVVLEVAPDFQHEPAGSEQSLCAIEQRRLSAAERLYAT